MLLFEFVVPGPPLSLGAKNRRKEAYRQKVEQAARDAWVPENAVIASPVAVTITHFYVGAPADVDNIPKLLLDGLKRVALQDDNLVSDLVVQRRPIAGPYSITAASPALTAALGTGEEFVHIAIASPPPNAELRPYDYP
jgi:hypothetical protein